MHNAAYTSIRVILASFILAACTPDPGLEGWCEKLKNKAKSEWTAEEIKKYTNECIGLSKD